MTRRGRRWPARVATAAVVAAATSPVWPRARPSTLVQSFLPWLAAPAIPITLGAVRRRQTGAAALAGLAASVTAAATLWQAVPRRRPPADGPAVRIGHVNLLYANARLREAAEVIDAMTVDIHTFSEFTPTHRDTLHAAIGTETWPYRVEHPALAASGTAVWSRWPLRVVEPPDTRHHTVVVDADTPAGTLRIVATHTQSPLIFHTEWSDDMTHLAGIDPQAGPPAVLVGDLNAVWWHPEFRALLRSGWRDAHVQRGRGLSPSWPYDGRFVPFLRLDHALVDERLVVEAVTDHEIPGDDHRGLIVTVRRAAR